MKKTVTIGEVVYTYAAITQGQFEDMLVEMKDDALAQNRYLVACCLNNADGGTRTKEEMRDWLRPVFTGLLAVCLEVNDLAKN